MDWKVENPSLFNKPNSVALLLWINETLCQIFSFSGSWALHYIMNINSGMVLRPWWLWHNWVLENVWRGSWRNTIVHSVLQAKIVITSKKKHAVINVIN